MVIYNNRYSRHAQAYTKQYFLTCNIFKTKQQLESTNIWTGISESIVFSIFNVINARWKASRGGGVIMHLYNINSEPDVELEGGGWAVLTRETLCNFRTRFIKLPALIWVVLV